MINEVVTEKPEGIVEMSGRCLVRISNDTKQVEVSYADNLPLQEIEIEEVLQHKIFVHDVMPVVILDLRQHRWAEYGIE